MADWETELAAVRQRLAECAHRAGGAVQQWQHDAEQRIPAADLAALDQPLDPADVPAEHRDSVDRVITGELAWDTVLAGEFDDEGARALSMRLDRRLQQLEEVGRLMRTGTPFEAACAQVGSRGDR